MIKLVTNRREYFERFGIWEEFATVEESLDYLWGLDRIANDTETTGLGFAFSELQCIQLGDAEVQFVIDCGTATRWEFGEPVDIQAYKELLESKTNIFHNAAFDLTFYYAQDIRILDVIDTMLGERILTTGMRSARIGFAPVLKRRYGIDLSKTERDSIIVDGLTKRENIEYSGYDVKYLHQLADDVQADIDALGLTNTWALENKFVCVNAYMEFCGIYLDQDMWLERTRKAEYEEYGAQLELDKFARDTYPNLMEGFEDFNWSAPGQVQALFQMIGIDTFDKKEKKHSVEKKAIQGQKSEFPIIGLYLTYKEKAKIVTTYGRIWFDYIQVDKRIHTKMRHQIVDTGRTSSGDTKAGPFPNLQNLPNDRELRHCFRGQGPNMLITVDYSGQESMILADKSRAPKLLKFYLEGLGDLHSYAASLIWSDYTYERYVEAKRKKDDGEPLDKDDRIMLENRQMAKTANFAIAYGGNGFTVAQNLNIDPKKGEVIYKKYMEAFPGLAKYFQEQRDLVMKRGFIVVNHVTNRRRFIEVSKDYDGDFAKWRAHFRNYNWTLYREEKRKNSDIFKEKLKPEVQKLFRFKSVIEKEALNTPCQGTGSDISKTAGVLMLNWIVKNKHWRTVKIVNFVHDEWVFEAHQATADKVAAAAQECMESASKKFLDVLPVIPANPVIKKYWDH